MAAMPVIKEFRSRFPEWHVLISVITPGGHEVATAQLGKLFEHVVYSPMDLPWIVNKSVRSISPDLYMILETELWPNMLHKLHRQGVPVAIINGRISDKSFPKYQKVRWLMNWCLSNVSAVLVQTGTDATRFEAIGAVKNGIQIIGNVKFDQAPDPVVGDSLADLRKSFGLTENTPIIVIGSTREAEEEKLIIAAYTELKKVYPRLTAIHAPRHVDRANEVRTLWQEAGFSPCLRSETKSGAPFSDQIILDTFGELAQVYALGKIAIVGNSITAPGGGQNILQPIAQGKPVLFGPYMQNFRDTVQLAIKSGVGFTVQSREEIVQEITRLLNSDDQKLSSVAMDIIRSNKGASARYVDVLERLVHGR